MELDLADIENEFRRNWMGFAPATYAAYLERVHEQRRLELLTRLLAAELEYAYRPPTTDLTRRLDPSLDDDERVRPSVHLFAMQYPELAQDSELMIRLVLLEYALRLRHDRLPPNPESYVQLCAQPQDRLIQLLELAENRLSGMKPTAEPLRGAKYNDSTVKESQVSASIHLDPLRMNLGYFLLLKMIGKGGMGFVHTALDLRSIAQVAVKVMRRTDAWSVDRFIAEFRWLSHLSHPNLVQLYDAFSDGDLRYFSMELVEGDTIRDWFKRQPQNAAKSWRRLKSVLSQAASATHYLHQNDVLHCDIKSSNVMISPRRRAVVLDLGLAIRTGDNNPMVGTLQYMAPELLNRQFPSPASDWYSFGVMMYEVMTDSYPPIQVQDSATGDHKTYNLDVEQFESRLKEAPEELQQLCFRLLSNVASDRPSGSQVIEALGGTIPVGSQPSSGLSFTGRDEELQALDLALQTSMHQRPACILLRGESGLGKTELLRRWLKTVDPTHYLVVPLRCYHQDHTPVRLLNSLLQELSILLRSIPTERWQPSLRQHVGSIRKLLPQVTQLIDDTPQPTAAFTPSAHDAETREAALRSLVLWLEDLSCERPMVLTIDDAHWSDLESRRALSHLLRPESRFKGMLVFVDELQPSIPPSQFFDVSPDSALEGVQAIELSPLSMETRLELLRRWAEESDVSLAPHLLQELALRSEGNPVLLHELAHPHVMAVQPTAAPPADTSHTAAGRIALQRRFAGLTMEAEVVLQYLAVSSQALGLHQLQMVTRILPHDLQQALNLLRSQKWIQSHRGESEVEIAHQNFRRVILQELPKDRLQRRHYRLARILSSESPPNWARLAGHYWSAERFREAAACYLEAARLAISSGANEETLTLLERAAHPSADRKPSEKIQVERMTADCLAALGRSQRAAIIYDSLLTRCDPRDALYLECLAGEQWVQAGQPAKGLQRLRGALEKLDITPWTHSPLTRIKMRIGAIRCALSKPMDDLPEQLQNTEFSNIQRCLNRIATPLAFLDNQLGPELILKLDRLARLQGTLVDRSQAILRSSIVLSFGGRSWRIIAAKRLRLACRMATRSGSTHAQAIANLGRCVWHIQRGNFSKGLHSGSRSLRYYELSPESSVWEQQFLKWCIMGCYWYMNDLQELIQYTSALRTSAQRREDPMPTFWTQIIASHWADLVLDRIDLARESIALAEQSAANQPFQSPRFFLWLSRVQQALYEDNPAVAQKILWEDWKPLKQSLSMQSNHYRWLAYSIRTCCNMLSARQNPQQREQWLSKARRGARRMLKLEEGGFVAYGKAFLLATDAAAGQVAPQQQWDAVVTELESHGLRLMALALAWHQGIYHPSSAGKNLCDIAQQRLVQQGCIAPERLLNVILPLPHSAANGKTNQPHPTNALDFEQRGRTEQDKDR
ncbi:serine/threonine-protein kinase [Aureliella helgolandensis]|uniref:Serine/threonine-protein kinase PrkC n=1 Tax=Aureliella helgolandensis TaxID=2527968 RepID=A0A518FZG9_9BACT|nr:serine/threonine-protein kinase [Aureliella helgolandensis]QDV21743.1 Serine/threonine-protein kinase PrkC [Aureliella helgolandensis]